LDKSINKSRAKILVFLFVFDKV